MAFKGAKNGRVTLLRKGNGAYFGKYLRNL